MATYGQINAENITSSTGGVISPNITSLRNRIINGAGLIDQRNAGSAVTNGNGTTYFVDRWMVYDGNGGSHFSIGQNLNSVTPPTGFKSYIGIKTTSAVSASATNNFTLTQYIEGYNVNDLTWGTANAKTVSISFWVQSSLTGTFAVMMSSETYDAQYVATYSIPVANTWTYITVTVPGPTIGTWSVTNGRGIDLRFDLGMGSNYAGTAGAWTASNIYTVTGATSVVGTSGATFYITGVQLEVGAQATSFDYRPYGTELALCQRYYFQNTGLASTTTNFGSATSISATQAYIQVPFPVSMRTGPTISYGGTVNVSDSNTYDLAISAIVTNQSNTNYGSGKVTTASGQTLYRPQTLWVNSTTSFLAFTAEL